MSKQKRQFTIKQIINEHHIANQEELVQRLRKEGLDVTQATLSRDLREMGVVRVNTAEGPRYSVSEFSEDLRLHTLLSLEIEQILHNESMVVIKTLPGRAQGVAELIDSLEYPEILATLAGDNTIFIAPKSVKMVKEIAQSLQEYITTPTG